jgi:hypothetical protein
VRRGWHGVLPLLNAPTIRPSMWLSSQCLNGVRLEVPTVVGLRVMVYGHKKALNAAAA